jgi:hypothetical protein
VRDLAENCATPLPMVVKRMCMDANAFRATLAADAPAANLPPTVAALWWDAKGDWERAHTLVDELETRDGMAVHAYLHRKEGATSNADYWYARAGHQFRRPTLEAEWEALVDALA